MSTLLLRLIAPLQSWGTQSRFGVRDSGREPSKSGILGLVCAALGRPRDAPLDDLLALRMGVRIDREGHMDSDYHTAQNVLQAAGGIKNTELSRRYYLSDAVFLAGLEGPSPLLATILAALQHPVWFLYLGRKAFVPSAPAWLPDGLCERLDLESALSSYPYLVTEGQPPARLRMVLDDLHGDEVRQDVPRSFAERAFSLRRVRTCFVTCPSTCLEEKPCTSPD